MGRKAIIKADIDGKVIREIPVRVTTTDGYFCLDGEGNLYITEWAWRRPFRLRKFDADGKPLKIGGKDALDDVEQPQATRERGSSHFRYAG